MCLLVPISLLTGCFLSHSRGDDPDTRPDSGPGGPDSGVNCTPPPGICCEDGAQVDGLLCPRLDCPGEWVDESECYVEPEPVTCDLARAEFTCLDDFQAASGTPFRLPVSFEGAHCCAEVQCAVRVDAGEEPQLHLTTAMCSDDCDCDSGNPYPTGACDVPALESGDWSVFVNDSYAFTLPVSPRPGIAAAECRRYPVADICGGDPRLGARYFPPETVCLEDNFGRAQLRFATRYSRCSNLEGVCRTTIVNDGGDARTLEVQMDTYGSNCDVLCADDPTLNERICPLPPLEPGVRYNVVGIGIGLSFTLDDIGICAASTLDG